MVLASLAFIVWNVGTRSPLGLVRDIGRTSSPRALFLGLIAFAIGLIFLIAALVLVLPALTNFDTDLWFALGLVFLVALAVEFLIGPDLRALASGKGSTAKN